MMNRDTEWVVLVTYARAAGARTASEAGDWAERAVALGQAPFKLMCDRIDEIARRMHGGSSG